MTYFKSVLVGLLATVIAFMLWVFVVVFFLVRPALNEAAAASNGAVGWDPISIIRNTSYLWAICLPAFMAGFIWEFRRLKSLGPKAG